VALGPGILIAGRYVIERKIGEGSWGEVWLGHHARVGMRVAVKALLSSKVSSHDAVVRFGREAKFLGRIQSDYVARVLDYLDDDVHGLVLVMEFVHGESLQDLVGAAPLGVERAVEIGCDIAAGLCDLHDARIVHRDLKPANIILRPLPGGRTRAVIIDFSLGRLVARPGDAESSLTQLTGAFMSVGTLPYMSPEQVLDSRKVTFASDVYSLGALLFRCVSARYVFPDEDDTVVAKKKLREEAPPLETGRDDDVARGLSRVVARALRKRPEERYPDAKEMLAELLALRDAARAHGVAVHEARTAEKPARTEDSASTEKLASPAVAEEAPAGRSRVLPVFAGVALLGVGVVLGVAGTRLRWGAAYEAATPVASAAPPVATAEEREAEATAAAAPAEGEALDAGAEVELSEDAASDATTVAAPVPPPTTWTVAALSTSAPPVQPAAPPTFTAPAPASSPPLAIAPPPSATLSAAPPHTTAPPSSAPISPY
jgi:tRNA A-37 threonylcarbamoyl transferase component Bud32